VVTTSQFSRRELERYARIPYDAITVIPGSGEHILGLPPDETVIRRLGLRPREFILGVNSHSIHKNVLGFARAVNLMQREDYDVVLAGGANTRIFQDGAKLPASRLRATGYLTDPELRALYQSAACFVYPSLYEGFGLPPLEAMACGCPVVVSRAASLPEVCGDAAVYCDSHDPSDIARAIDRVLADATLQEDLRRCSKERASRFSWKAAARTMLDIVEERTG
jgi:glycosyltransferase involved in cell wall biosynthesis